MYWTSIPLISPHPHEVDRNALEEHPLVGQHDDEPKDDALQPPPHPNITRGLKNAKLVNLEKEHTHRILECMVGPCRASSVMFPWLLGVDLVRLHKHLGGFMYSVVKNDGLRLQVTIHGWPTREVCKVHKNSCLHYHGSEFMNEKKLKLLDDLDSRISSSSDTGLNKCGFNYSLRPKPVISKGRRKHWGVVIAFF
ncbi:hypothetical protein CFP56_025983 [Quercus suber]|uniref:Uncharacterized protein n=1 Tax=Quercus suber TaxID=58331 RepID=A0AAW0LWR4_QUESU